MNKTGIWGAISIALALTVLVGCSTGPSDPSDKSYSKLSERTIALEDGRDLTCVVFHAGYAGGLSCDWANASPAPTPAN